MFKGYLPVACNAQSRPSIVFCCILLWIICSSYFALNFSLVLPLCLSQILSPARLSLPLAVLSFRKTKSHFQRPQRNLKRCAPVRRLFLRLNENCHTLPQLLPTLPPPPVLPSLSLTNACVALCQCHAHFGTVNAGAFEVLRLLWFFLVFLLPLANCLSVSHFRPLFISPSWLLFVFN